MVSRDDLFKAFALVVVLAFVLGTFSYQGQGKYIDQNTATPTPAPAAGGILGTADSVATLYSYPDGVIAVSGSNAANDAGLRQTLRNLSSQGKVAYFNSASADSVNIVLVPGANVSEIAWMLERGFPLYTSTARAQLALPDEIAFQTSQGIVRAPIGSRSSLQLEPLLSVGENVSIYITAMLSEGAITQMQVELAESEGVVLLNGTVGDLKNKWIADAEVPWENRTNVNDSALGAWLNSTYPNSTLIWQLRAFIAYGQNATPGQQVKLENLSYASVVLSDFLMVNESFTDRAQAEADMRAIFGENASVQFPPSLLSMNITTSSFSEPLLRDAVGIGDTLRIRRFGAFQLGSIVQVEGRDFALAGGASLERAFPLNASTGDAFAHVVKVRTRGARIIALQ